MRAPAARAAAHLWSEASEAVDRLEGLAHEIAARHSAAGRVGTASVFHVSERRRLQRWGLDTLLSEFNTACSLVRGLCAALFVQYRDHVTFEGELYTRRLMRTRIVVRREILFDADAGPGAAV